MAETVRLAPMTDEQFGPYRAAAEVHYAQSFIDSGSLPEEEAREQAASDFARLLPDGLTSPGHHFFSAFDGDEEVGMLWLHLEQKSDGLHAFGYDFSVREDLRRRGYGRAIMLAAERWCGEQGVVGVGLNVFGGNVAAQSLYEQMGFQVTSVRMRKSLRPDDVSG